ncbi:iron dicitrate transporter FecR [Bacteroidia bacterium]|nr:iron dicitrate transporter FecR [Bacteroidia bacterium]
MEKEQNSEEMNTGPIDGNMIAEVCEKVVTLVYATKQPDEPIEKMSQSKEDIYNRLLRKMDTASFPINPNERRKNGYLRFLLAACITLLCVQTVYWFVVKDNSNASPAIVELNVPNGITANVVLPDGTIALLNGGSKLLYPSSFGDERQISLAGEIFLDVVKDKEHPFIVKTKNLTVKVLGTRFGFAAYDDDAHTVVTLEEGSIEAFPGDNGVGSTGILLESNQQLILENQTSEFLRRNVNAYEYISWKDGILNFRNQTLREISHILERRFSVSIAIQSEEIASENYVAQFKYGENLEQILDALSYKRSWTYVKKQDGIKITKR